MGRHYLTYHIKQLKNGDHNVIIEKLIMNSYVC